MMDGVQTVIVGVVIFSFALLLALTIIIWFSVRRIWPFVTAQIQRTQAESTRAREQFITALSQHNRTSEQMVTVIRALGDAVERSNTDSARDRKRL